MGKFFVYVIKSREGYFYKGHTPDLERRLREHNNALCHSTKHGKDWKIIYTEEYATRSEAMKREKWLKSGVGREWFKQKLAGWSPAPAGVARRAHNPKVVGLIPTLSGLPPLLNKQPGSKRIRLLH